LKGKANPRVRNPKVENKTHVQRAAPRKKCTASGSKETDNRIGNNEEATE